MKKRVISIFLTLTMLIGIAVVLPVSTSAVDVWDGTSNQFKGEGTKYSPYVIRDGKNLKYLQQQVADGETYGGKYFVLANNINLGGEEWAAIGGGASTPFSGVFDGNGFTISGLSITQSSTTHFGLFGYVTSTATNIAVVSNLTVQGNIEFDTADTFVGESLIGGLVGETNSNASNRRIIIINCVSKVNITINKPTTATQHIHVGGAVGRGRNITFYNCINEANVNINYGISSGTNNIIRSGGIIGLQYNCNYTNTTNYGNVDVVQSIPARNLEFVGGIIGGSGTTSSTTLTNCANYGNVTAENKINRQCRAAGFVGGFWANTATINNCYNVGNITSKITSTVSPQAGNIAYAGGLVAIADKEGTTLRITVKNSYNSGTITATGGSAQYAGGIAGFMNTETTGALNKIENCATTTSAVLGGGTTPTTDSTENISAQDFSNYIAPIDATILAGTDYDYLANVTDAGAVINITTSFRGSARLVTDTNGLRFTTEIKNSLIETLNTEHGVGNYTVGTLIAPLSYVDEAGAFTKEALDALTKTSIKYLDITADISNPYATTSDGVVIAASIVNIKSSNYDMKFAAIGYVLADGVYTYSNTYSVRCISEIATAALADVSTTQSAQYNYITDLGTYSPYTAEQRQILQSYLLT